MGNTPQILIKSRVKAHTRRAKSGKVVRVREHVTSKTKKPELPKVQRPAPAPEPETITDLFGEAVDGKTVVTTEEIPIAAISRDPTQPREHFDKKKLQELGQSIKKLGLVQDIAIRPDPDTEDRYIIIAGERRWRAMQLIEKELTSAKVYHTTDPKEIASIQVAENVGRVQMNPMEEAKAFQKLQDAGYTLEEVASRAGASLTTVERRISFLELIPSLQEMVKTGALSVRRAEIIAGANLRSQYQQNIIRRLNAGPVSREALRGMVGKYQTAQTQTVLFAPEGSAIDQRITHQRRKSLERDFDTLLNDFGDLMSRIIEKDGAKIIPALAKEKGRLAVFARKVSMISEQMKKFDREMKFAEEYFRAGGTINQYLNAKGVKGKKRRRTRKSLLHTLEKGKKFEVGHVSTYRDGSRWRKVSNTGDPVKDWRQTRGVPKKAQAKRALVSRNPKYSTKAWQEQYINDYIQIIGRPVHTPGMQARIKRMEQIFRSRTGKDIRKFTQRVEGIHSQQIMHIPKAKIEQARRNYRELDVRAPEFKKWFGDWESGGKDVSKVVDTKRRPQKNHASEVNLEGGKPRVVYHGTHYGGFRAFDKNTLLPGLFGRGFYFTENKDVAESYKEKGTNVAMLGTMYDTIYLVQEEENRKKVNSYAAQRLPDAESKLQQVLKMIEDQKAGMSFRDLAKKYDYRWISKGWLTARRGALKKRIASLKSVPNMTDVQLNQFIDQSKFLHKTHMETDYGFHKLVSKNIPTLEPQTYSVYLNIRNPLDMDKPIPKALKDQFRNDPAFKQMIKETRESQRGQAQVAALQLDEEKYDEKIREMWRQRTYLQFYSYIKTFTAKRVQLFGGLDDNINNDIIVQRMLRHGNHDGITHIGGDATNSEIKHRVWITLQPIQVKAVENRGTFNPKDSDLYKGPQMMLKSNYRIGVMI